MTTHGESVMNNMNGVPFIKVKIFDYDIYRVFREGTDIIKIVLVRDGKETEFTKV